MFFLFLAMICEELDGKGFVCSFVSMFSLSIEFGYKRRYSSQLVLAVRTALAVRAAFIA